MTLVVDASLVVAALTDMGAGGKWALSLINLNDLRAPHVMPVEVVHSLRRTAMTGRLPQETVQRAHDDLLTLTVELYPYEPLARRVWELRQNITPYDAWYVALAEALGVGLATLDRRLAMAVGPRCAFVTPPV